MFKKILSMTIIGMCISSFSSINAYAEELNTEMSIISENQTAQPYATGLISGNSLSCSVGSKTVYINATTKSASSMEKIGFKDIKIQRSSDGVNWTTEKNVGDLLKQSTSSYGLQNYAVSVKGGYYYRVTLTHYAKESGLFGSSQSISNTSYNVWIA